MASTRRREPLRNGRRINKEKPKGHAKKMHRPRIILWQRLRATKKEESDTNQAQECRECATRYLSEYGGQNAQDR